MVFFQKRTPFSALKNAFIILFIVAFPLMLGSCKTSDETGKIVIGEINFSKIKDGSYEGEQKGMLVSAKVLATVKAGKLETVKIIKHGHGPGHGAEAIIDRVLAAQNLNVDVVSGATMSSKVMLKAIESALEKGK